MKRALFFAAIAGLTLSACGAEDTASTPTTSSSSSTMTRIWQAGVACNITRLPQDEGMSITLDTRGKEDEGIDDLYDPLEDVTCMLEQLDAPDYVTQHIESTRALDGMQTDEWDDMKARWTYHPDDGLSLTLIDQSTS